ncbi:Oidioi.mRNA.OKI2018_I69.chr2.g5204.t1.cds [Oikopleura dioica]|uniref:Oidioi.mRNA.OKI2018_I69.chr2.g5204.t1.cds n=1 Tax=Oikopleura dioica TaxID=34765 RepID=A0ABN7T305_OIKDI|nr:Oidioi.mRNA.OKI2018_I69.chr2.g5204.t1.cds [Oikopleura dioica]
MPEIFSSSTRATPLPNERKKIHLLNDEFKSSLVEKSDTVITYESRISYETAILYPAPSAENIFFPNEKNSIGHCALFITQSLQNTGTKIGGRVYVNDEISNPGLFSRNFLASNHIQDLADEVIHKIQRRGVLDSHLLDFAYASPFFGSYYSHKETQSLEESLKNVIEELKENELKLESNIGTINARIFDSISNVTKTIRAPFDQETVSWILDTQMSRYKKLTTVAHCFLQRTNLCSGLDFHTEQIFVGLCKGSQTSFPKDGDKETTRICEEIVRNGLFEVHHANVLPYSNEKTLLGLKINLKVSFPIGLTRFHRVEVQSRGRIAGKKFEKPDFAGSVIIKNHIDGKFNTFKRERYVL